MYVQVLKFTTPQVSEFFSEPRWLMAGDARRHVSQHQLYVVMSRTSYSPIPTIINLLVNLHLTRHSAPINSQFLDFIHALFHFTIQSYAQRVKQSNGFIPNYNPDYPLRSSSIFANFTTDQPAVSRSRAPGPPPCSRFGKPPSSTA